MSSKNSKPKFKTSLSQDNMDVQMTDYNSTTQNEQENLINSLKTQIFSMEQNEKNYDLLNKKYIELQNENTKLNEEKINLEIIISKKESTYKKQLAIINEKI